MTYEETIRYAKGLTKSGGNVQRQEFGKVVIEALEKQNELAKGIEDLKDTLSDAYALNDFVLNKVIIGKPLTEAEIIAESFSLKAMQNLSWLLAVIDGSDNE